MDPARREMYLSEADFAAVFGMPMAEFQKQPKWKQQNAKRPGSVLTLRRDTESVSGRMVFWRSTTGGSSKMSKMFRCLRDRAGVGSLGLGASWVEGPERVACVWLVSGRPAVVWG